MPVNVDLNKEETLLYPLFEYLRRRNFALGISEYLLAIKTLRSGFGLESPGQMKQLLRLLWAKSEEEQAHFDEAYAMFIEPRMQIATGDYETETQDKTIPPPEQPDRGYKTPGPMPRDKKEEIETKEEVIKKSAVHASPVVVESTDFLKAGYFPKSRTYFFSPHIPFKPRDMAVIWRQLRGLKIVKHSRELDVPGTVKKICRTGVFIGAAFKPVTRNRLHFTLLLDRQGSMVPFSLIVDALEKSVEYSGRDHLVNKYYFHDVPGNRLFKKPGLTGRIELDDIPGLDETGHALLIVSDGGAARGYYDSRRVDKTKEFIRRLNERHVPHAWLNPLPSSRWKGTTAGDISGFVPMFPVDREGLSHAVMVLQGKCSV